MDNEMVQAIRNRKEIMPTYLSIAKMLDLSGMSEYESICCRRALEFADDKHIMLDICTCDVLIDDIGLIACYDILQGYISDEKLLEYKTYSKAINGAIRGKNKQIKAMRDCPTNSIKEVMKNPSQYFGNDAELSQKFVDMLRLELKARKPLNRLRVAIKRIVDRIASYIRNYRAISVVKRCFRKLSQE
ncbi:MAG: hypothetical protein ACI4D0_06590 [Lachnospira sp.]